LVCANGCHKKEINIAVFGGGSAFGTRNFSQETLTVIVHNYDSESLSISVFEGGKDRSGVIQNRQSKSVTISYYPGTAVVLTIEALTSNGAIDRGGPGSFLVPITIPFFSIIPQQRNLTIFSVEERRYDLQ